MFYRSMNTSPFHQSVENYQRLFVTCEYASILCNEKTRKCDGKDTISIGLNKYPLKNYHLVEEGVL